MIGAEGVVNAVLTVLEANMPARCTAMEARLGVTPGSIPPPAQYSATDLPDLDVPKYPLVIVEVTGETDMERVDLDAGDNWTYKVSYGVRVHLLFRASKADDVTGAELGRYRLKLAATEALLLHAGLTGGVRLAQQRIVGKNAPYMRDSPGRVISAGYLDLPVTAEETLTEPPLAAAPLTVAVVASTLP